MQANSCGYAWATVEIQELQPGPATALIQTGYHTQTSTNRDGCGTGTPPSLVTEYATHQYPDILRCVIYAYLGSSGTQQGDQVKVQYASGSNTWQSYDNGTAEIPGALALGFSSGYSVARGEVAVTDTTRPNFYITWGTGPIWEFMTNSSGCCTTYTGVASNASQATRDDLDSDNDWYIGHPDPPSNPFYIQWIG
jgi:hypothetical protein